MIVPFSAGGPNDTVARILIERMRASLGQPVVIENVTGANGTIGAGRVARAPPDGYTLGVGSFNSHVVNGAVYKLSYDVLRDFEPVAMLSTSTSIIVAKKTMPANTLRELIDWLKANPDRGLVGTPGVGSSVQVYYAFLQEPHGHPLSAGALSGLGAGDAGPGGRADRLRHRIPVDGAAANLGGKIKAYAVTDKRRLAAAPDIPTVDEAGLPGFYTASWYGIWVPKDTPKDIIGKLNAAVVDALADPAVQARLSDFGQEAVPRELQTPEALGAYHKAEIEKWWPIIKAAGIRIE